MYPHYISIIYLQITVLHRITFHSTFVEEKSYLVYKSTSFLGDCFKYRNKQLIIANEI